MVRAPLFTDALMITRSTSLVQRVLIFSAGILSRRALFSSIDKTSTLYVSSPASATRKSPTLTISPSISSIFAGIDSLPWLMMAFTIQDFGSFKVILIVCPHSTHWTTASGGFFRNAKSVSSPQTGQSKMM